MSYNRILTVTAAVFAMLGLTFLIYSVLVEMLFGIQRGLFAGHGPALNLMGFRFSHFIPLGGALLLGCGMLSWAVRHVASAETQRGVSVALCLTTLLLGYELATFDDRWLTTALTAKLLAGVCGLLAAGYGYLLLRWRPPAASDLAPAPTRAGLRQQWARQIGAAAAQQERNRLARELHDSIKQQLFSINVSAATAQTRAASDPAGAQAALAAVREGAHEALVEMEALLQHLRPAPLENVGLVEALRKQCEALQYRSGASVTAEFGPLPDNERLPPGAQEALFRIAQEALANIARHARAQTVHLRLYADDGQATGAETLWLKLTDDGQGFDTAAYRTGMGLANMQARAQEIGADVQWESAPSQGVSLVLRLPLVVLDDKAVRRQLWLSFASGIVAVTLLALTMRQHWRTVYPLVLLAFALAGVAVHYGAAVQRRLAEWESLKGAPRKIVLQLKRQMQQGWLLFFTIMLSLSDYTARRRDLSSVVFTLLVLAWQFYALQQAVSAEQRVLTAVEARVRRSELWRSGWVSLLLALPLCWLYARAHLLAGAFSVALSALSYAAFAAWWRWLAAGSEPAGNEPAGNEQGGFAS